MGSILRVKTPDGTWTDIPAMIGPAGEKGDPGVFVGESAPTDPSVQVWVNPSGEATKDEAQWELIETNTLTEEISAFERTVDPLKGIYVVFTSPGIATAINASISIYFHDGTSFYTYGTNVIGAAAGYKSIYRAERTNGNMWRLLQTYGGTNFEPNPARVTERIREDEEGILRLKVNANIPAGTIIEIWGVRA